MSSVNYVNAGFIPLTPVQINPVQTPKKPPNVNVITSNVVNGNGILGGLISQPYIS